MTFLNPLVLFGLAAAAIPIVVHLFNFRRPKEVDFSTLRFLREVERQSMRRLRVRQWLLLALRTLAILFLVLAFAQPTRPGAWDGVFEAGAARSLALVVDNSLSTGLRDAEGARLDGARALADGLVSATGRGDERTLVTTAPQPGLSPVAYRTPEPVQDALAELAPASGAASLSATLARAASLLEGAQHPRREIVAFSDLQASTLTDSAGARLPEDVAVTLVAVGAGGEVRNTAVTDVRVESQIIEPGRPVEVAATVERWGGEAETIAARLFLDGRPVAEGAADVAPGRPATVRFTATPPARGWLGGEVRIEPDGAEWDDARSFALRVPPPPRVLLASGGDARADLARLALEVAAERGALNVTEVDEAGLAGADLDAFDAVFLVAPRTVGAGVAQSLARFARGGGGVLLFAGEGVAAGGADALLGALGAGRFSGARGQTATASGAPEATARLGDADLGHPVFAGVFADASPRLEEVAISRLAEYRASGGATLLGTTAGPPLLHETRTGDGALLVMSVPPDPAWSELPERGLFVPLVLRAASYLAAGSEIADAAALSSREGGSVRVEGAEAGAPLRLIGPGGVTLTPPQRTVPGAVVLSVGPEAAEPGLYRVLQGERELRVVAVNGDARESDPTPLGADAAAEVLERETGRPVRVLEAADGLAALEREGGASGVPLWTWCLALALACLVAESLVASRWRPEREAAAA